MVIAQKKIFPFQRTGKAHVDKGDGSSIFFVSRGLCFRLRATLAAQVQSTTETMMLNSSVRFATRATSRQAAFLLSARRTAATAASTAASSSAASSSTRSAFLAAGGLAAIAASVVSLFPSVGLCKAPGYSTAFSLCLLRCSRSALLYTLIFLTNELRSNKLDSPLEKQHCKLKVFSQ